MGFINVGVSIEHDQFIVYLHNIAQHAFTHCVGSENTPPRMHSTTKNRRICRSDFLQQAARKDVAASQLDSDHRTKIYLCRVWAVEIPAERCFFHPQTAETDVKEQKEEELTAQAIFFARKNDSSRLKIGKSKPNTDYFRLIFFSPISNFVQSFQFSFLFRFFTSCWRCWWFRLCCAAGFAQAVEYSIHPANGSNFTEWNIRNDINTDRCCDNE